MLCSIKSDYLLHIRVYGRGVKKGGLIDSNECYLTRFDNVYIIVCKLTNLHMEVIELLDEKVVDVQSEFSLLGDEEIEYDFGSYLRAVRRARKISVRQLAKAVGKTPTYLSDIEQQNNRPPEKELLDSIIRELELDDYPKVITKLYDLAAMERNDVPADIKEYIINNRDLINLIRNAKDRPNSDLLWKKISHNI